MSDSKHFVSIAWERVKRFGRDPLEGADGRCWYAGYPPFGSPPHLAGAQQEEEAARFMRAAPDAPPLKKAA